MTTHELARELLKRPDVMATVSGYEGGVNEVTQVATADPIKLFHNDKDEWYYGRHEYYSSYETVIEPVVKAVHIG